RTNAGTTTTYFEQRRNLIGENSFSCHARVPLRIVQPVTPHMPDLPQYFLFAVREMFLQPVLEQWRNRPGQADDCIAGKLRASFCARSQDLWNLVISESGNNRRDHHADWNFCRTKLSNRIEASLRRGRARFEDSLQS